MPKKFFDGNCIVEFAFKVTVNDDPKHIMDFYLLLHWNLTQKFGILKMER